MTLTLASSSETRARLLRAAGVDFVARPARVDEDAIKAALINERATPRDVADALAEMKALKGAGAGLVLGADQVLDHHGSILSKPADQAEALANLQTLRGDTHRLHTAAVLAEDGRAIWRHVAEVRLTMRMATDAYLEDYVERNWNSIRHSVGAYLLEGEGARLFTRIDGDHFAVQGLPLLELLDVLIVRGTLAA